ncbi:MAG: WD40 repeat domain-containing protein [candidate division KSB1 bacterium]|nr:WD40 repeat domain-containing protein [candidate division KSB1 bacterium]MDZ7309838.1 WD40 repeat domain-containing protein [candidate division KSB1 bacterium]
MFHFYIGSQLGWEKYLKNTSLFKVLKGEIRRNSQKERMAISQQTEEIIASREALSKRFSSGFDAINLTLESGFGRMEDIINGVGASIDALRASFDYNMALMIEQFQLQNQTMLHFLQEMEAVHATLENPTLTQAREYYRIGCDRLSKGLLDKAMEALHESEKKDDTNFMTQLLIGKLYLYGVTDDCNVLDLKKAEKHLRAAARYAKAEARVLPEANRFAGEALLHASISCYAQAQEQVLQGNTAGAQQLLQDSFELARQATETYPQLSEAFYHQAKFSALLGDGKTAAASLKRAIELDEAYCLKAESDFDFRFVLSDVNQLFHGLRNKTGDEVRQKLQAARRLLSDWIYPSPEAKTVEAEIRRRLSEAERCLERNTYFDNREALELIQQAEQTFKSLLVHKSIHHTLEAHRSRITSLAFSPDQGILASGAGDGSIHLWQQPENQRRATLYGHKDAVTQLAFSHDGEKLVSVDRRGGVKLWHVASNKLLCDLINPEQPVHCVAFSPDDTMLAVGKYDREATLWEVSDGSLIHTFNGHKSSVDTVIFSSDGTMLATGSPDNTAMLWEVRTGQLLHTFVGCSGLTNCLTFSSDDTQLICGASDGSVRFYSVRDGRLLHALPESSSTVSWLALSPNANILATLHYGKAIQLWDVLNKRLLHSLKPFSPGISAVRFSPDGMILAASDYQDRSVKLWNVQDGKLMHVIAGTITCAEFSPDGAILVTGDESGTLKFWERMVITRDAFEAGKKRETMTPPPRGTTATHGSLGTMGAKPRMHEHKPGRVTIVNATHPADPIYQKGHKPPQNTEPRLQHAGHHMAARHQEVRQPEFKMMPMDEDNAPGVSPVELEVERLLKKQQRQAARLAKMGRCLECGKKLGFFAKLWGLKFCKEHGF